MGSVFSILAVSSKNLLYAKRLGNQNQSDRPIAQTYRGRSPDRVKYLQHADNNYGATAERRRVRRARLCSASGELEARSQLDTPAQRRG
ncbi:MAG: hypothetical protein ACRC62_12450 [Microcoleus sp.]